MTSVRIIYTRLDGGVNVVCPTDEYLSQFPTEAEGAAAVIAKDVPPDATSIRVCDKADVPSSRRFRNCWRRIGPGLPQVDMPLARVQRMNETREGRAPKLTKSDVDFLRAQESGNTDLQTQLKTYRQALRDLPQTSQVSVDACATPEQLETWAPTWPADPAA